MLLVEDRARLVLHDPEAKEQLGRERDSGRFKPRPDAGIIESDDVAARAVSPLKRHDAPLRGDDKEGLDDGGIFTEDAVMAIERACCGEGLAHLRLVEAEGARVLKSLFFADASVIEQPCRPGAGGPSQFPARTLVTLSK